MSGWLASHLCEHAHMAGVIWWCVLQVQNKLGRGEISVPLAFREESFNTCHAKELLLWRAVIGCVIDFHNSQLVCQVPLL